MKVSSRPSYPEELHKDVPALRYVAKVLSTN